MTKMKSNKFKILTQFSIKPNLLHCTLMCTFLLYMILMWTIRNIRWSGYLGKCTSQLKWVESWHSEQWFKKWIFKSQLTLSNWPSFDSMMDIHPSLAGDPDSFSLQCKTWVWFYCTGPWFPGGSTNTCRRNFIWMPVDRCKINQRGKDCDADREKTKLAKDIQDSAQWSRNTGGWRLLVFTPGRSVGSFALVRTKLNFYFPLWYGSLSHCG